MNASDISVHASEPAQHQAAILVGTASWTDHEPFYPPEYQRKEMSAQRISYYARYFPLVEIDSTFYRLQPQRNFQLWSERTPDGFRFDVKAYGELTWHHRTEEGQTIQPRAETFAQFSEMMQPLRDAGKLRAILFQFPPWFVRRPENLDYLRRVREAFPDDRIGVEFRHRSWLEGDHVPSLLEAMREMGVSLTVVDEPQVGTGSIPTVLEVTNPDLVLVRFHGRNAQMWYARVQTTAERFDYLYTEDELREWVPKVAHLAQGAREVHLLFNNNARDYAVRNARQLMGLLREGVPDAEVVAPPGAPS